MIDMKAKSKEQRDENLRKQYDPAQQVIPPPASGFVQPDRRLTPR